MLHRAKHTNRKPVLVVLGDLQRCPGSYPRKCKHVMLLGKRDFACIIKITEFQTQA